MEQLRQARNIQRQELIPKGEQQEKMTQRIPEAMAPTAHAPRSYFLISTTSPLVLKACGFSEIFPEVSSFWFGADSNQKIPFSYWNSLLDTLTFLWPRPHVPEALWTSPWPSSLSLWTSVWGYPSSPHQYRWEQLLAPKEGYVISAQTSPITRGLASPMSIVTGMLLLSQPRERVL